MKEFIKEFTNKEVIKESWNVFWNESNTKGSISKFIEYGYHQKKKEIITEYMLSNKNIIFIIGEWGSGKSIFSIYLSEKLKLEKPNYYYKHISFFGISKIEEAYLHILSIYSKGITCIVVTFLLILSFYLTNDSFNLSITMSSIIFTYFIATNKLKLSYIIISLFESFYLLIKNKHKIIILDDFDRSSLKEEDRWALLSNVIKYRRKFIIPIGYNLINEMYKIQENIEKLEAKLFRIEINPAVSNNILYKYLGNNKSKFPIKIKEENILKQEFEFINIFNLREVVMICDHFNFLLKKNIEKYEYEDSGTLISQLSILEYIFSLIKEKVYKDDLKNTNLNINYYKLFYDKSIQIIHPSDPNHIYSLFNDILNSIIDNSINIYKEEFDTVNSLNKNKIITFRNLILSNSYDLLNFRETIKKLNKNTVYPLYDWFFILFINRKNILSNQELVLELTNYYFETDYSNYSNNFEKNFFKSIINNYVKKLSKYQ